MQKRSKKAYTDTTPYTTSSTSFVTAAEVAKAVGLTPRTIRRLMEAGELPGRKFGSEWRMHRADFDRITAPQLPKRAA